MDSKADIIISVYYQFSTSNVSQMNYGQGRKSQHQLFSSLWEASASRHNLGLSHCYDKPDQEIPKVG